MKKGQSGQSCPVSFFTINTWKLRMHVHRPLFSYNIKTP